MDFWLGKKLEMEYAETRLVTKQRKLEVADTEPLLQVRGRKRTFRGETLEEEVWG